MEIITNSAKETQKAGKSLAQKISKKEKKKKKATVIALEGDLGSGKTTFIQGMAKGLAIKEPITSPTFVILKKYPVRSSAIEHFYHLDCYRLDSSKDISDLGFEEIINSPGSLIVIEWAERIRNILPKDCLLIEFEHLGKDKRKIKYKKSRLF